MIRAINIWHYFLLAVTPYNFKEQKQPSVSDFAVDFMKGKSLYIFGYIIYNFQYSLG